MQIVQLIEALRNSSPINFIWGSGCSGLYRSSITYPGDRSIDEAVKKYDSDPLLSEIKRKFFHRTAGLEDVHSCLLALNDYARKQVLNCRTNWANICAAELLRTGHAARVLTTNFDGSLVRATATFGMMLPLYKGDYPELRHASTPSIYLLGSAAPEIVAGLVERGAATGPWIVVGTIGMHLGLSQTLLSVNRFEQGLYWVGHFHESPPVELRDGFFQPERNAHWITGFDADSFMAYLLRGLGEFPPPALLPDGRKNEPQRCLKTFEDQRPRPPDLPSMLPEVDRLQRADGPEVRAFLEKLATDEELAVRAGHPAFAFGHVAHTLAEHRSPLEMKPFLSKAASLMEADAPGFGANFTQVCCKLAQYSYGERADQWYARADASFSQMDFGPQCGAIMPYGHLPRWAELLAEWACFESSEQSEAIFKRARAKFLEAIARSAEAADSPARAEAAGRYRKTAIAGFIPNYHRRARMISPDQARPLLEEARKWLEELRPDELSYADLLARHLFREAEVAPERQVALLAEAEEQFRTLLRLVPRQAATVLCNWASALGDLAMARSGEEALRLYGQAGRKFQEVEHINPDLPLLQKNWSSLLIREARVRGGAPELLEQARRHAAHVDAIVTGDGGYNLACIAAETNDRESIVQWLSHSADYGRIPRLSHILRDVSFERHRQELWFRKLLDGIFDAGLAPE
jgi:hypothetical protein